MRSNSWGAACALLLGLAASGVARAEDDEAAPAAEPQREAPVQRLPPVTVRAPRIEAGPATPGPRRASTPLRREAEVFDLPAAVTVLDDSDLTQRRLVRSVPDALLRLPGVMVQKTAPLQASPYVRGFTGYHNLLMVDGIRLNHSAMRSGPNQYWSTVDPWTIERLELARGPHSVLYGSDAVGGTLNAITRRRRSFCPGTHVGGGLRLRYASAESAVAGRVQVEGNRDGLGWLAGFTYRDFGNIDSGGLVLPATGGIEEADADLRFDLHLGRRWRAVAAWQRVRQYDAPRTEQTIFSVPFRGTQVGSELQRDLDQERDLAYLRLLYDGRGRGGVERGQLTFSYHRHRQERDRRRTGNRQDVSGFTLGQYGVQLELESRTRLGRLTYGVEYYHDEVDSFREDRVGGVTTLIEVQGPVGDDATYDLLGVYLQDQLTFGRLDLIAGARLTYAAADAARVDNPAVPGADPATPGNVISVSNDWTSLVGSLRAVYRLSRGWNLYAGISQAFRAPTLHDLTSLDATSAVETPSPDLEPERYVAFEGGAKTEQRNVSAQGSAWLMLIDDAIIQTPTGALIGGTPEVRKSNVGDGWAAGFELEGAARLGRALVAFGNLSWMDSEVDERDPATGALITSPLSREKPWTALAGLRFEPPRSRAWAQAEAAWSGRADDLSERDKADRRRIPPGGTPGWAVLNLRAGVALSRSANLALAVENVFNENYRIHGSGQNEPGRSFVLGLDLDWPPRR